MALLIWCDSFCFWPRCCDKFLSELKDSCVFKQVNNVASRGIESVLGKVWVTPVFAWFLFFLGRPSALARWKPCWSTDLEYFSKTRQFSGGKKKLLSQIRASCWRTKYIESYLVFKLQSVRKSNSKRLLGLDGVISQILESTHMGVDPLQLREWNSHSSPSAASEGFWQERAR